MPGKLSHAEIALSTAKADSPHHTNSFRAADKTALLQFSTSGHGWGRALTIAFRSVKR
jgi:hypothetical protein